MPTLIRCALIAGVFSLSPAWAFADTITLYTSEAAFNLAASPTLVEDFESVAPKDTELTTLTHNGITYTPFGGTNIWVASPGYTNFGTGVGTTTTSILTANGDEFFGATFSTPYFAVGFDTYLNGLGPASVTFYNGLTLLGTINYPTGDDKEFAGIISTIPVTSFQWTSTLGGRLNTGIDNIAASNISSVPEPATLLMVGAGLVELRRRRRNSQRRSEVSQCEF